MSEPGSLVLASASPRRQELLRRLNIPFEVFVPRGVDENAATGSAREIATALAQEKAEAALRSLIASQPGRGDRWVVLGTDTVVAVGDGENEVVLGKPRDLDHARKMLRLLAGKAHRVWTGVAVACAGQPTRVEAERTDVTFRPLSEDDVERYLATGDHEGKAGAYGIQGEGSSLVSGFQGCYYNVVGLPLVLVARMIADLAPAFRCDCFTHPLQQDNSTVFPRRCVPEQPLPQQ